MYSTHTQYLYLIHIHIIIAWYDYELKLLAIDRGTAIDMITIKQKKMQKTTNTTPNMASAIFPPCRQKGCTVWGVRCVSVSVRCEGACVSVSSVGMIEEQ